MRKHLDGLEVLWVGVRCDPEVAAARELARGDRVVGMGVSQATAVHEGVQYDVEVDTTSTEALECAGHREASAMMPAHGPGARPQ